jgi:hypothetical protein
MTLREFLQIELWSSETSRRVIRKTWKIVRPIALVSGVLIVLLGVAFEVESRWFTNAERKAGKAALAKIEELDRLERNASDGFDVMNDQAKASVVIAEQKVWTLRDRQVSNELEFYRWELETNHEARIRDLQLESIAIEKHLKWHNNPEFEQKMRDEDSQILGSIHSLLHKELD